MITEPVPVSPQDTPKPAGHTNPRALSRVRLAWEVAAMTVMRAGRRGTALAKDVDGLAAWAEGTGRRRAGERARGGLGFAFYGRVSTEDWQDPVTSRARQREQAEALVRGHG